ncbi:hypothetical protein DPMN_157047 [Dreissena polymorpha]|uniref:Uncharacterized protein n=1 Tax=Dreissena polymorpha TaxID=45954 RepID=A0A9D4EF83_DREPO|nr:hypothetical protein DPMN_157047 [Dreissena polymorpha]
MQQHYPVPVRLSAGPDERKNTSFSDRSLFVTEVLNYVTHRTADGSDVPSLTDAWRSDTSAGDLIICDLGIIH